MPQPKIVVAAMDSSTKVIKAPMLVLTERYKSLEGEYIETVGILWNQFENVSICSNGGGCFWIGFHPQLDYNSIDSLKLSGKWVRIKGLIDTSHRGHLGMYLAAIKNIYFIQ
jgi:hypothetical protein